jgi:hypothetical protein
MTLRPETTLITKVACGFRLIGRILVFGSRGEHRDGTLPSARYTVTFIVGYRGGHNGTGRLVQNHYPSRLGAGYFTTEGSERSRLTILSATPKPLRHIRLRLPYCASTSQTTLHAGKALRR